MEHQRHEAAILNVPSTPLSSLPGTGVPWRRWIPAAGAECGWMRLLSEPRLQPVGPRGLILARRMQQRRGRRAAFPG